MRPLKKTEVCNAVSRRVRYKLCKEVDGKFYSVIAGTARDFDAEMLEYENGRVTESPSFGTANEDTPANGLIYVYEDLDDAIEAAGKVGGIKARAQDKRVIFKVTPIGFKRDNRQINGVTLCEAILVGNAEWENEPAPPEPVWKDVTKECTVTLQHGLGGGYFIQLAHSCLTIAELGIDNACGADFKTPETYKVEAVGDVKWMNFLVFKKDC